MFLKQIKRKPKCHLRCFDPTNSIDVYDGGEWKSIGCYSRLLLVYEKTALKHAAAWRSLLSSSPKDDAPLTDKSMSRDAPIDPPLTGIRRIRAWPAVTGHMSDAVLLPITRAGIQRRSPTRVSSVQIFLPDHNLFRHFLCDTCEKVSAAPLSFYLHYSCIFCRHLVNVEHLPI